MSNFLGHPILSTYFAIIFDTNHLGMPFSEHRLHIWFSRTTFHGMSIFIGHPILSTYLAITFDINHLGMSYSEHRLHQWFPRTAFAQTINFSRTPYSHLVLGYTAKSRHLKHILKLFEDSLVWKVFSVLFKTPFINLHHLIDS